MTSFDPASMRAKWEHEPDCELKRAALKMCDDYEKALETIVHSKEQAIAVLKDKPTMPPTITQNELLAISNLFWQFHKDRLTDPTINDMTPYIKPILEWSQRQVLAERIKENERWEIVARARNEFANAPSIRRLDFHDRIAELKAERDM